MSDITQPLRLAVGSHKAGTGKGCAMNVISWENGDKTITDFPECADQYLASEVQMLNDTYCTHRDGDLLCPACSVIVLGVAHRLVGTGTAMFDRFDLHERDDVHETWRRRLCALDSNEAYRVELCKIIDEFYAITGLVEQSPPPAETVQAAVASMLADGFESTNHQQPRQRRGNHANH
jgi:hypothetical protein